MAFVSYAQNNEDVLLYRALKHIKKGFYIDVGANDPNADSVTRAFYDRGWRGINVEPISQWFERLKKDRPLDWNFQVAAGSKAEEISFFEVADMGLSTSNAVFANQHKSAGCTVKNITVPVRRLDSLCAEAGLTEVHFLKIDVEGMEKEVLQGVNLQKIRPWIILIESTEPNSTVETHQQWESLLTNNGYVFCYFDGLNRFYLAKEHSKALKPAFLVPPNPVDGFIGYRENQYKADAKEIHEKFATLHHRGEQLELELQSKNVSLANLDASLKAVNQLAQEAQALAEKRAQELNELNHSAKLSAVNFENARQEKEALAGEIKAQQELLQKQLHALGESKGIIGALEKNVTAERSGKEALAAEIKAQQDLLLKQERELDEFKNLSQTLEGLLASERQEKETLRAELAFKHIQLNQLQESLSWRMTCPIRKLNALFKLTRGARAKAKPKNAMIAQPALKKIFVDLTPVLPGGVNGGAKIMTLELLQALSRLLPQTQFILLTSSISHEELSFLDRKNIERVCVNFNSSTTLGQPLLARCKHRLAAHPRLFRAAKTVKKVVGAVGLKKPLMACAFVMLKTARLLTGSRGLSAVNSPIHKEASDVLFCPFTAPFYADGQCSVVSVVYDLQYKFYPEFFSAEDRAQREHTIRMACEKSDRIVCISNYVKETLLEAQSIAPDRVDVVPISLSHRLPKIPEPKKKAVLTELQLTAGNYVLYPANFWAHKNHQMLLVAFNMFVREYKNSSLSLVCSGAPGPGKEKFIEMVSKMDLSHRVLVTNYLSNDSFAGLMESCKAVIFPSLYEGFGMPVLEAMVYQKPVLCSRTTSLPEVGGDAVLYFDPRKPTEIVQALDRLERMSGAETTALIEREKAQLAFFGDAEKMANAYIEEFQKAVSDFRR